MKELTKKRINKFKHSKYDHEEAKFFDKSSKKQFKSKKNKNKKVKLEEIYEEWEDF